MKLIWREGVSRCCLGDYRCYFKELCDHQTLINCVCVFCSEEQELIPSWCRTAPIGEVDIWCGTCSRGWMLAQTPILLIKTSLHICGEFVILQSFIEMFQHVSRFWHAKICWGHTILILITKSKMREKHQTLNVQWDGSMVTLTSIMVHLTH